MPRRRSTLVFILREYDKNIFTPVIRSAIREAKVKDKGHYTIYLPAYDDKKLVELLLKIKSKVRWHIFSKHTKNAYHVGLISVYPVSGQDFVESVVSGTGVLCGAGFEGSGGSTSSQQETAGGTDEKPV